MNVLTQLAKERIEELGPEFKYDSTLRAHTACPHCVPTLTHFELSRR